MKNIMTIDLEDYYHCNLGNNDVLNKRKSTVVKNTNKLLELFRKNNTKATFFTLGVVAEDFPELIQKINNDNHEIASHGYGHELVYDLTPEDFERDLQKSKEAIKNAIGKTPVGYRAPSWSITKKNLWALDILEKNGFKYSSSIFPIKTFLYGIPGSPDEPNHPVIDGENRADFYEIPPSVANFGIKKLGFSGGFYFRFFPFWLIAFLIRRRNKQGKPVVCYLHPWEIDPNPPKLDLHGLNRIIHYYNIKGCYKKFDKLLKKFDFVSIEEYLKEREDY